MVSKGDKSKEQVEREELEAQLMGGEIAEEKPPVEEEVSTQQEGEVETVQTAQEEVENTPEEDIEAIKQRLAKIEEERSNLERGLREEREAKKQTERAMASILDRIEEAQKEREARTMPVQEEIPDRQTDPAGFLAWQQEQTLKELRELKGERQQERQLSKQEQEQRQFLTEYQRQLDEFAQKTPDYNDAAQFLAQNRDEELQALGIYDPQQRQQMLHQDALQIGAFCMQQGRNPAQTFYELAKKRGFQPKKPVIAEQNSEKPIVQPKSLSQIGGKPSGIGETLQARADRILTTTRWDEIVDLDPKEMDKVLREMR